MTFKNTNKKHKTTTLKTFLMLSVVTMMMLIPGGIIPVHAAPGDVLSIIEINDSTANGPTLSDTDYFGWSVANIGDLDGDGVDDIVVGAIFDSDAGFYRGAVHIIFLNADSTPKSTVVINDSTANGPILSDNDQFGRSVSNIGDLDGDGVNDIVVGVHGDDAGGNDRGAVHIIFLNTDGTPKSTVEINSNTVNGPTLSNDDLFGRSVSNIGDLDGDGVNDIAVGTIYDDEGGSNRGAVHIIFLNTDGTPKSTVEINDSTINGPILSDDDRFGTSVSNIGDLDGDGVNDIAVGAYADDAGGSGRGTVHIILLNADGTPKSTVEINSNTVNGPTLNDSDYFGVSVANIGDLDGDGVNAIAVGAYGDDEGGSGRGAVHIIFLDGILPDSTSTTGTVQILTTCGVQFNSGAPISYGAVLPGDTSNEQTLVLYNSGNIAGDILVSGSDWVDGILITQMNVGDTKYATITGDYSSKTSLLLTDQTILTLNPQVNTDTFWQLQANLLDTLFSGSLTQTVDFSVTC